MKSPIRFIETPNVNGGTTLHKVEYNIGLTDHELHCLKKIIKQWRDDRGFPDEKPTPARKLTMASTARRIERELNRAIERPETHFE
tara:strand:+ start:448 stop:705 length:258 start_codon:yes stop_codon:yes gene_type:complete